MNHKISRKLKLCGRRGLPEAVSASVDEKIDSLMAGKWSIDDVIEMHMDETSIAGNVGSGIVKPIGTRPEDEEKTEELAERILSTTGPRPTKGAVVSALYELSPGSSDKIVNRVFDAIRRRK